MDITIETTVNATLQQAWDAWTTPSDITQWNFASDDWCCPAATIDLTPGGTFNSRMEAKDGSFGFDFTGTFAEVDAPNKLVYNIGDGRLVTVTFATVEDGTRVTETFETEDTHTAEQQREGWQSILNQFKKHVESKTQG